MRTLRGTTIRWRSPTQLRMERFAELLAKTKYADLLGMEFISGLEKRNDLLEGRFYKALAIQLPLFFMLAFSLLNVDVKVTLLGFSIDSARSLREILLVLSIPAALFTAGIQLHQSSIKELLTTSIRRVAGKDPDLKAILEVRYGLSYFATVPGGDLNSGWFQLILGLLLLVMLFIFMGVMIVAALTVQIASMREILLHPNFSPAISKLVVVFVVSGDVLLLLLAVLITGIQPYQSVEDLKKLNKLAEREPEKAKQIVEEILREHMSKGWIRRTFGRPTMRRL